MIWVFWDYWEMFWPNAHWVFKSTLLHEMIDLIIGFLLNHEFIFKVDFQRVERDKLKGVVFSTELGMTLMSNTPELCVTTELRLKYP